MTTRQNTIRELTYEAIASGVTSPTQIRTAIAVEFPDVAPEEIGEAIRWLQDVSRIEHTRDGYRATGSPTHVPFSLRRGLFPRIYA